MDSGVLVVLSTFPDMAKARSVTAELVEARLAACGNIIPGLRSVFRWEGRFDESSEVLVVFKTTRTAYPAFERLLLGLHPYEVPEILALPIERGAEAYLKWVADETGGISDESRPSG